MGIETLPQPKDGVVEYFTSRYDQRKIYKYVQKYE
jgi:hypothetical protein